MPSTPDFVTCEFCGRELHRVTVPDWVADLYALTDAEVNTVYEQCGCQKAILLRTKRLEAKWEADAVAAVGDAKSRMRAAAARAGIPDGYVLRGMDDKALYAELLKTLDAGKGLFLTGGTGTGKTHAACAVAQRFLRCGKTVRFADPEQIEREVKASWRHDLNDDERSVIARYVTADLVVIDDLGAEVMNAVTMKALRAIVSGREANGRVTVFTSNLTREQLAQRIADGTDEVMADRMASRIKGMTRMFAFGGPDRRISR